MKTIRFERDANGIYIKAKRRSEPKLVSKKEALKIVNYHVHDKPGVVDLDVYMELLTWQNKLLLWILKEKSEAKLNNKENKS